MRAGGRGNFEKWRPVIRRLRHRNPLADQSGAALFLVIWILALLMVIVGEFSYSMRAEVNATRQFKEAAAARYIAEAGINRAILEILKQQNLAAAEDAPELLEAEEGAWRVNIVLPEVDFPGGRFRVYIDNDSGRVNINTAERGTLQMLVDGFDLTETEKDTIVDSILDWRDDDDLHRLNGAENDYYQALPDPYPCKNGPFDSPSELLLVRGITRDLFHEGLKEMITVALDDERQGGRRRSRTRAERMAGSGTININAARPQMLAALPKMTDDTIQDIWTYRETGDFLSLDDVADVVGSEVFEAIAPYISLRMSPYYVIHTEGRLADGHVRQLISTRVRIDHETEEKYAILERRIN